MKYKIGDKVRIKNFDWYNENKNKYGEINVGNGYWNKQIKNFCSSIMTIYRIVDNKWYMMRETFETAIWIDEMIECKVEEEMPLDKAGQITDFEYEGLAYTLPNGYQFVDENGNEILTSKILLKKKKKEYPKTYLKCCDILEIQDIISQGVNGYLRDKLETLQKLLICRDAYWKIAGEEMGLDGPWEPDWNNEEQDKYGFHDEVKYTIINSAIFVFPTSKMRDAFKKFLIHI